jgi:hypothetical protein
VLRQVLQETVMFYRPAVVALAVPLALALGACGVEVATTAATAASLQAAQATQAKAQQRQIEDKLGAALKVGENRAAAEGN